MPAAREIRSGNATPILVWCAVVLILPLLSGCQSPPKPEIDIPLPGFGDEGPTKPRGVYAVIRRADVPLDQSTDDAWALINEQVVPPVTRGAWRGNGLRIGLLQRDQLDRYSAVMPQPVGFSRMLMNRSTYPAPIVETPKLRSNVRFEVDLTLPPRPRLVEKANGGESSTLRLLAQVQTLDDGRHTLVLTPQHHIPSPLNLIPRDPIEKEMDGRVYDELALRVVLGKDQIAVIGLHWPWPMSEVIEEDEPVAPSTVDRVSLHTSTGLRATERDDPAAPPAHLRDFDRALQDGDKPIDQRDRPQPVEPEPRYERAAPPLERSLGSMLFTGTRIRQPVQTILMITIEDPEAEQPALPAE